MSYLIFCSFEVGGLPYRFADVLNRHGVRTYYISIDKPANRHDSTAFHYGNDMVKDWDLSKSFCASAEKEDVIVKKLCDLKNKLGIKGCFATGSKSYLLSMADMPYAYWSHGADIDYLYPPFFSSYIRAFLKECYYKFFGRPCFFQDMIDTLDASKKLMISPYQKSVLKKIGLEKELFFLPHAYSVQNDFNIITEYKKNSKEILCKRFHIDNFFFSPTRHVWKNKNNMTADNKGNDITIKSFYLYLKRSGDSNTSLILVNKGSDVAATKKLISSLSIARRVIWIEEAKRDELSRYYHGASMCLGHFGTPVLTNAVLEPMACGTPCISYYVVECENIPFYRSTPTAINLSDPDKIADCMLKISNDKQFADKLSYESWEWVKKSCSEEVFVDKFTGVLK